MVEDLNDDGKDDLLMQFSRLDNDDLDDDELDENDIAGKDKRKEFKVLFSQ